jgi:hypothetical protein
MLIEDFLRERSKGLTLPNDLRGIRLHEQSKGFPRNLLSTLCCANPHTMWGGAKFSCSGYLKSFTGLECERVGSNGDFCQVTTSSPNIKS